MKAFKWFIMVCFILGIGFVVASFAYGANFNELRDLFDDSDQYSEVKSYNFSESATKIMIDVEERHIEFVYSDVSYVTVDYREHENDTWTFDLEGDTIEITQKKANRWRFINFGFTPKVYKEMTIFLPIGTEYAFDVSTNVGAITFDFDQTESVIELIANSDTGSIKINNVNVQGDFDLSSDTGSISLNDITGNKLSVDLSTGSCEVKNFMFNHVEVYTSTGDVLLENGEASLTVNAHVSTGSIEVNKVASNAFDLSSSTGDVLIITEQADSLYFDLKVSTGRIRVYGQNQGTTHVTQSSTTQTILLKVRTSTGNITINQA